MKKNEDGGDESSSDSSTMVMTGNGKKKSVEIRADHIAKIAAELLLDLS